MTLATTSRVVVRGQLAWLGILGAVTAVAFTVMLIVLSNARGPGGVTDSIWQTVGAGWPRWLAVAAGAATIVVSLPRLVTNGVTRRESANAFVVALVVTSGVATLFVALGYLVENAVFDSNDWRQGLPTGAELVMADLARVLVEAAAVIAASFVAGWLIAIGFYRFGRAGVLCVIPALVPLALCELVTSRDFGSVLGASDIATGRTTRPELAAVVAAGATVIVVAAAAARALTRGAVIRSREWLPPNTA